MTRNDIFLENQNMINRTIRRNRTLLYALNLDLDDVYQELAIAALHAIDTFDPARSGCIRAHIWMQLQYAVLDMKERQKPCGFTSLCGERPAVVSVDYAEAHGLFPTSRQAETGLSPELRRALSRLDGKEREAVLRYLDGGKAKKDAAFQSALGKLRGIYLNLEQGCAVCAR